MTAALIQVCVFPDATYDDFVDQFKEAEGTGQCRYGVFDAEYQTKDGNTKNKLVFFMWSVIFLLSVVERLFLKTMCPVK